MVKVQNSKGIASRAGPESCVAHREMRDEALTGKPAGQPLSRESFKSVQGADAVSVAEGNTDARNILPPQSPGGSCHEQNDGPTEIYKMS